MTETRLLLIWKIANDDLSQNIAALKLIRFFLMTMKNAPVFPGLLIKCPKLKWIVSGRKYVTYFAQPTIMSFFRAVWKTLMKYRADGCWTGKAFLQLHLPCPSLPQSTAEPGTQHQPLPPAPLENNDFPIHPSCFPQNGNIRLFILDWQQTLRPIKKKKKILLEK